LDTDGRHHSQYDPRLVGIVLGEAAHLLRNVGFAAHHTVVIGGLVPSLLVPSPVTRRPHVGTTDIDLCLSVAIVDGDTAHYERIETALRRAGYGPTAESFRWRQRVGPGLAVEFFCPAGAGREAGRIFRPRGTESPTAKHNLGASLSALALAAGGVIADDVIVVPRHVVLPNDGGRTTYEFRVTGLLGFLVAKLAALVGRDKPKDAYDIVWIIENTIGGPTQVARAVRASVAFGRPDAQAALDRLFDEFATTDRLGPQSYASFAADAIGGTEDRARLALQAVGALRELRRALER
jgi:hypothetical protein